MAFQSTVSLAQGFGVVGELFTDAPHRAAPYNLVSADAAYNVFGRAFTVSSEGVAAAGGTGVFAGILANPKTHASYGTTAAGTLAPTLTLSNNVVAGLVEMGEMIVSLPDAAAIGDKVTYDTTTGALSTLAPTASFTASQTTTVLTVTAITAGNLGVGSVVQTGALLSVIESLGTGTGGTGTYNVSTSQSVSSTKMTATSVAASGKAFVPNAYVDRYTVSGAGLAVIKLNN